MFGLSKDERNFKEAKAYIEAQSVSLENRKLTFEDGLAILSIGYLELNKTFKNDYQEPDIEGIKGELNLYFDEFKETKDIIKKSYEAITSKDEEDFLKNISAFLFVENFFKDDVSDLVISILVQRVEEKFFPNAGLVGNKFYQKFLAFGTLLYSIGYIGRSLHAYEDWEQIDRRGYEIEGAIKFYKVFRLLREHKLKSKINGYKDEKAFLTNL